MKPGSDIKGMALVILGAALFGTTGTAMTLGACDIAPWLSGGFRLVIGGPLLLILSLAAGPGQKLSETRFPFGLIFWAVVGVVVFQFAFFEAVHRTGVAAGTLVSIGSTPVFAGILGRCCFGDRLDRDWWGATALAVTGCACLASPEQGMAFNPGGLGLALASGASYAVYVAAGRGLVQILAPARAVGLVLSMGGLVMLPFILAADLRGLSNPSVLASLSWLGIFATALSYFTMAAGLKRLPVNRASVLLLVEPLVGCLLGIFLLGEPFVPVSGMGMVLIFSAMVVIALSPRDSAASA